MYHRYWSLRQCSTFVQMTRARLWAHIVGTRHGNTRDIMLSWGVCRTYVNLVLRVTPHLDRVPNAQEQSLAT